MLCGGDQSFHVVAGTLLVLCVYACDSYAIPAICGDGYLLEAEKQLLKTIGARVHHACDRWGGAPWWFMECLIVVSDCC